MLLGFEKPESGSILYENQDISQVDAAKVRKQMGVVLQNGGLMPGDIFTNIIGASTLTLDDAWQAAEMAGFAEDIKAMPMGMHTVISEGASTLSGGRSSGLSSLAHWPAGPTCCSSTKPRVRWTTAHRRS
ncbi:ATP-binding cassette domain-containing protein [Salidesulfovibrio brasiliensis]|uniref:ATP-binding cassette domain-containing protein n=1 Tax=Salidesulfovibrio brasiliensis TaxID=221711 RepID=UPI0006D1D61F|nr:ATP-binding cassette domain-containing protein [Salidesulfovibrio brasiliensis]